RAEVGDDVYGEDPTTRRLEERVAQLLGKEAALFVPSGTMSNQIALQVHTRRGDEVVVAEAAHVVNDESGAGAAWSGVQFTSVGAEGAFTVQDLERAVRPISDFVPRTALVWIENTHNRSGGRVFPQTEILGLAVRARELGLALHLDGARLWNAAVASRTSEQELAAPFDTVSVCFSKGLGAPVGSALVGRKQEIDRARRFRKMLGGGMRQSGVLAAAALYAVEHHRERLALDHEAALRLAQVIGEAPGVTVKHPETNIVVAELAQPVARAVVLECERAGLLLYALSPTTLRLVTHLDLGADDIQAAARVLLGVLDRMASNPSA
ncbi:MAG TPA: low specificity L-threonine aldolase, partial [Polyangiaceae bacterium]|nr:low specificity L-threonine aldolase [Polyangiaceae bacterium]